MPPDEDGERQGQGRGQGLAMLRLEARRYKREMQQIWMQRELHEQKKSTASFSSEDSSRNPDRWRFADTFTTSPATSGTPMFWNREDVAVAHFEQLAIVEEGTQTDTPSKSEVQTETEKLQYDADVVLNMGESMTMSSTADDLRMLKSCSRHCDELRSRISQEAACECLANAAIRVNADVVFTAKPKRVAVETQVETPERNYSRVFRPDEKGTVSQIFTIATSPTGSLKKGQKITDPVQYFRTGLRGMASPVPQYDSACSPIRNFHDSGARFRSLRDTSKDTTPTEMFSWQQDRSEPERCSILPPPTFSTQVSTPQPEASCGGTKAGDNISDFSTDISGIKRTRSELTGESAMAARLAIKIKHALEAIGGKADTRSTNSTFNLPGRATQSIAACRSLRNDDCPEMKLFEDADETFGGAPLNNKEIASSDSSLPLASQHARRVHVSSFQNHSSRMPGSDADEYFQNVMAALSTDRYTSNKLSGSCTAGEVSPVRALRRAERRAEAARRANIKSCGDHYASHQPDGLKNSVKNDVRQSGSNHVREKQRLLSNVQKLQSVAETAKRLYTDLVDCAYDELRASTDRGNLVKHQDRDDARGVCKFSRPINEFCSSMEKTSDSRRGVASTANDEVCGRCHVCQPQFISRENHQECMEDTAPSTCRDSCPCDIKQRPEEVRTDSLDEITIHLSDDSTANITLSKNHCTKGPGYNVEISTPYESPCQRECSPNNRGENIVSRGSASWKDSCKPVMHRTGSNQQMKKCPNKCLLDPRCDGPRDNCHMPTRRCQSPTRAKCSRASTVDVSQTFKKDSNKCLLDPGCDGPRDSCHMPTRRCPSPTRRCQSPTSAKCFRASPRNSYQIPTRSKCSRASTICISQPTKGSNECRLDSCCVGPRDSCHMPTYDKSSRASCGPGGGSRLKRNHGTNLYNNDPFVLSRCPVHCRRRIESTKGELENNSCCGKIRSAGKVHRKILHDEIPGHTLLLERKERSPGRPCREISTFSRGRLDENSKVRPRSECRDHRDLCMIHAQGNDIRSSSKKGKENANGGHEETAGPRQNERMSLNNPVKIVHGLCQDCSRIKGVGKRPTLTATEVIKKKHAFVGKKTRQPPGRYMTGNMSALSEAYTETILSHELPSDHVDRAAAAAGLAKEIEGMIANQLGKSNRRIRESNYLMSRRKLSEVQNESFGQTELDAGIIAAANAVKKLKSVSLLPVVKKVEGNQRATPRKGPKPRAKWMAEDAIGSAFYDQNVRKELEELALWRKQLVRNEQAHFQSQALLFPRQEHDGHAGFSIKGRSFSDLKNLANAHSELEKTRSVRMQRSEEFSSFWDEPIGSHTLGSKRLRSTSPVRDHSNKLLRLNLGKAESQAGRLKQDQHPTALANRMSSSFGRSKPPPEKGQSKTTNKKKIFTTRKIRPPAWVERMSKAKDVFTSRLRPTLLAQSRKEMQVKPTFRRRTLRPPGLMFTSSVKSKQFGKHIPGGRALQPNPSRIQRKNPVAPSQYDINTGRKIVHSEREPGELLHTRVEKQDVCPSFKSLDEKYIRITRRPIVKIGMIPSAATNSGRYHLRVKGWNADPLIRSDIPHKPADIIRHNRNGGLDVQVRRRDADGKHKTFTGTSVGQRNVRQVSFAGMVVHNSRDKRRPKGLSAPHSSDSLQTQVTDKKLITSQPRRVKSALRKRRSSSTTKIQPMRDRDKIHRYGGGGGQWTFHEGFWTEMFKSEKESQDDSFQSLMTPGLISQLDTPTLALKGAQVIEIETLNKPAERVGAEEFLTTVSSVSVKSVNDEDAIGMAGERVALEGDGKSLNPALFQSLDFFGSDGLEGGGIIDHSSVIAMKGFLCSSPRNEEDERAQSCSDVKLAIKPKKQIQVSKIASPNQEPPKPDPSSNEFTQSPLRLLDEVFPDSTENETLVSMFNRLQESSSVQNEAQSDDQCPASECITRKTILDTLANEHEGKLKEIELKRTLMDIVLRTILQDDPVQDLEVFATRVEPISLPTNRRVGMRADKEIEAVVYSHDMSQSPLSKAVLCVDRPTEHDIVPHVDRATELDVVPHVDRATELDISSLFSKDQDSQTTNVELQVPNIQRLTPPIQEDCSAKLQCTEVHHQATEIRAPRNTVGIQAPDTTATISVPLSPPAATPMLMPVYFQQWGTRIFPTVLPTFHFELPVRMTTSSDVQPPPASAVNSNFPAGVNQGTQATESHIQLNSKETAVQVHHQVSKLPINSRAACGQLGVLEEDSDSDWEELKGGSSPSTPSTPLSSPDHKTSLKKAMELYPVNSSSVRGTPFARNDPHPSISEACQTLVSELAPPIQMVTETITEDISVHGPPQTMAVNERRRGTSWAKVKEMEEATLALLRAASTKTPSATSSSEYSRESSLEFRTWKSPGEVDVEEVERSSTGGRFLQNMYNTRTFQWDLGKPAQSHAWSSFGSGRASVGEIYNPVRFLGLLSEGEVEAGMMSTLDEPGQIQIGYKFALHSRTDLKGQSSEPGEFHVDADAPSP